jgi:hypothetical protein
MAIREDCTLHGVYMVPAVAGVGRLLRQFPKFTNLAALGASELFSVPKIEKVSYAGVFGRKPLEKVVNCEGVSHFPSPDRQNIGTPITYVKFIITSNYL